MRGDSVSSINTILIDLPFRSYHFLLLDHSNVSLSLGRIVSSEAEQKILQTGNIPLLVTFNRIWICRPTLLCRKEHFLGTTTLCVKVFDLIIMSHSHTNRYASPSTASKAQLVNVSKDIELSSPPEDSISALSWSGAGDILAVTSWDSTLRIYDVSNTLFGKPMAMIGFERSVLSCHWSSVSFVRL